MAIEDNLRSSDCKSHSISLFPIEDPFGCLLFIKDLEEVIHPETIEDVFYL